MVIQADPIVQADPLGQADPGSDQEMVDESFVEPEVDGEGVVEGAAGEGAAVATKEQSKKKKKKKESIVSVTAVLKTTLTEDER